jgi:hypothetical protein
LNLTVIIRLVRNYTQERTIAVFQLAAATLLPHHLHIRVITKDGYRRGTQYAGGL